MSIFSPTAEARGRAFTTARRRDVTPRKRSAEEDRRQRAVLTALPSLTGRTLEMSADDEELGVLLAARATVLVRIEPDPSRARLGVLQGRTRVRAGSIRRRLPLRHYDTIVCVGQLEDVPPSEAPLVRERLVRSLASEGLLLLQHGPGAETLHPPFLDHGLETVSLEVLDGVETLLLRRRRASLSGDARWMLSDLVREPWPAPARPSHWGDAEADLDTGQVVEIPIDGRDDGRSATGRRLLLRAGGRPAGMTAAPGPLASKERLAAELTLGVASDIAPRLRSRVTEPQEILQAIREGLRCPRHPMTSVPRLLEAGELLVAICTTREPDQCERLVGDLARSIDVVVMENGTDRPRLDKMCAAAGAAHDHDRRPGLAAARNRALAGTTARWVLFVDDDCELGPRGSSELARRLGGAMDRAPDAGAIGGLVLPASMERAAEEEFERVAGHDRGFLPARYDAHSSSDRWWPLRNADWMAVGACLAVRREAWVAVGGFDERLGAGTPAASAEDDAFLRDVVEAGWSVFYDPSIVVHHRHRASSAALRRQLFGYGLGRSVNVLLHAFDTRDWEQLMLWAHLLADAWRQERSRRLRLAGAEMRGFLTGPAIALGAARRAGRTGRV